MDQERCPEGRSTNVPFSEYIIEHTMCSSSLRGTHARPDGNNASTSPIMYLS